MKHTPGPWILDKHQNGYSIRADSNGRFVAAIQGAYSNADKELECDAKLIAAAPEMLEALEKSLDSMIYAANLLQVPNNSTFKENLNAMKLAINKAKGQ